MQQLLLAPTKPIGFQFKVNLHQSPTTTSEVVAESPNRVINYSCRSSPEAREDRVYTIAEERVDCTHDSKFQVWLVIILTSPAVIIFIRLGELGARPLGVMRIETLVWLDRGPAQGQLPESSLTCSYVKP